MLIVGCGNAKGHVSLPRTSCSRKFFNCPLITHAAVARWNIQQRPGINSLVMFWIINFIATSFWRQYVCFGMCNYTFYFITEMKTFLFIPSLCRIILFMFIQFQQLLRKCSTINHFRSIRKCMDTKKYTNKCIFFMCKIHMNNHIINKKGVTTYLYYKYKTKRNLNLWSESVCS